MELILWRHAEAEDADAKGDLARSLTKHGRKQARQMADWLKPRLEGEWRVVASPAARTLQTIEALGLDFELSDALAPGASPDMVLREAGWPSARKNVIVVGHQPTLGEVAAELLHSGDGDVSMRKGAVWWFSTRERDGNTETVLKAVVDPDIAAG